MKNKALLIIAIALSLPMSLQAQETKEAKPQRGNLVFSDDFERDELGKEWIEHFETVSIQDGKLTITQEPEKHPAIARHEMNFEDVRFEFNLHFSDKAKRGLLVVNGDDKHVFHASFVKKPQEIVISLKDYTRPANIVQTTIKLKDGSYAVSLTLIENTLNAVVDGESILTLKSPGLSAKKDLFQLNGVGQSMQYDNLKVWDIKASQ